jgi:hypothetical protein
MSIGYFVDLSLWILGVELGLVELLGNAVSSGERGFAASRGRWSSN